MTSSWKGRGNQYIQFARVLYCKLPSNDKQLPAFLSEAMTGIEPRPQRWEARVLPLSHRGPCHISRDMATNKMAFHPAMKWWLPVYHLGHLWSSIKLDINIICAMTEWLSSDPLHLHIVITAVQRD